MDDPDKMVLFFKIDARMFGNFHNCKGCFYLEGEQLDRPRDIPYQIEQRIKAKESMENFLFAVKSCETYKHFKDIFEYLAFCAVCYGSLFCWMHGTPLH